MKRTALFTLVLLMISGLALGQAVVTPSGQATSNGAVVPVAPVSPPLLVTPIVHLSNSPTETSPTGVSALTAPQPPTAPGSRAEIEYGQPTTIYVTQPALSGSVAAAPPATAAATQFDLGVNSSAAIAVSDGQNGRSLGEIARQMRQNMQNANAKLYTNSDVEKLPSAGGITGTTANASPQQFPTNGTYPVGNNGVILQNGQPMGQAIATPGNSGANNGGTATEQPMNQAPGTSPANNAQPEQQQAPQKPSAGSITPRQTSQAAVPANPADQNAEASQAGREPASNPQQGTLPKSASLLPLIALVGAGATVAGLMARK